MFLLDTHAHLNLPDYSPKELADLRKELAKKEIGVINVGVDEKSSQQAIFLAGQEKFFWATVGVHPSVVQEKFLAKQEIISFSKIRALAAQKKVAAIGEIGLDYFRLPKEEKLAAAVKEKQKEFFQKQFALAQEFNLPVVIHCRSAHQDLFPLLAELKEQYPVARVLLHCFNKNLKLAQKYLSLGCLLSFNGIITFASGFEWIKELSFDDFVLETDSPYLTPAPYRQEKNTPLNVFLVAQKIAEIKGVPLAQAAAASIARAQEFFSLKI